MMVVVTLGAAGSALFTTAGRLDAPGFRVPVVDTTGGGDCFHAAYLAAGNAGLEDVDRRLFANAAAALKVQHLGARGGLPTFSQVEEFLAQHG
ncbi:MAG: carbohydrate kinase family protein [Thiobacillus sp.]|nr:carbohydrate kinase family protein [Thiobacillus sp.]